MKIKLFILFLLVGSFFISCNLPTNNDESINGKLIAPAVTHEHEYRSWLYNEYDHPVSAPSGSTYTCTATTWRYKCICGDYSSQVHVTHSSSYCFLH